MAASEHMQQAQFGSQPIDTKPVGAGGTAPLATQLKVPHTSVPVNATDTYMTPVGAAYKSPSSNGKRVRHDRK